MKVHLDCFPCFLRQSLIALRLGTRDESLHEEVLKAVLADIRDTDTAKPPAHTTTFIHRRIRQMLAKDPFQGIKSEYNGKALALYPSLKRLIEQSRDPLRTAVRLAVAGNVIDFGIFSSVDIEGTIAKSLENTFAEDDYPSFAESVRSTDEIVYLLDNAGEIVFDRLCIETLIQADKKIKAVVKGSPVLNDATIADARESGLADICEVIDNGSDAVGTILEWTSPEFREIFQNAQLIISKGQGNFETLHETAKNIFYLFQSKCEVLSRELGLPPGSMLLRKS
ncbi:MAG: damage-control phosphatase ARMT1 family protein [Nitrospirota bacterium]